MDVPSRKRARTEREKKMYAARQDFYPYKRYSNAMRSAVSLKFPRGSAGSKGIYGDSWVTADPLQRSFRKAARFKGQGSYRDVAKWGLRGAGAIAGGVAGLPGGVAGILSGAQSGWNAGANVSKFAGFGSYGPVAVNSLIQDSDNLALNSQQNISVNSSSAEGDVVIEFSEFVQNVTVTATGAGSTPFSVQSFYLNPGLATVFPWLAQVATNFTLYEFEGLMFQYKPTSGEFGSTNSNALGKVIMATNYDPDATAFTNSQAMENYDYAVSSKPSCGMVHGVETKSTQRFSNQLYVRGTTSSKDKVLTDVGLFQVATEGIYAGAASTFIIGELWVTYKIKLSRKYLGQTFLGTSIAYDWFYLPPSSTAHTTINSSPGNSMVANVNNSILGTLTNVSATVARYTWPVGVSSGYYQVQVIIVCPAGSSVNSDLTGFGGSSNCTIKSPGSNIPGIGVIPLGTTLSAPANLGNTANACYMSSFRVAINAPGTLQAYVNLAFDMHLIAPANATVYPFMVVEVVQIPQNMYLS